MSAPKDRTAAAHWRRVKELLADALERPAAQRASFIERACGPDGALRAEVSALIAADADSGGALEALRPRAAPDGASADAPAQWIGRRVGPYRIVSLLGSALAPARHPLE